jgi:hypothetical protein
VAFKGPYPTKFSGTTSAMVISHTTFSGGVTNVGTIGAGGIALSSSTLLAGDIIDTGVIYDGVRINGHSRIIVSGGTAIDVHDTPRFGGGISNAGVISATARH